MEKRKNLVITLIIVLDPVHPTDRIPPTASPQMHLAEREQHAETRLTPEHLPVQRPATIKHHRGHRCRICDNLRQVGRRQIPSTRERHRESGHHQPRISPVLVRRLQTRGTPSRIASLVSLFGTLSLTPCFFRFDRTFKTPSSSCCSSS